MGVRAKLHLGATLADLRDWLPYDLKRVLLAM